MTRLLLATVALLLAFAAPAAAESVTIDGNSAGRTFDGIGMVSAGASSRLLYDYPEPERSQILDYLFKPGYGASYQLLKVEIGGDENSTDGSEASHERARGEVNCDRGYEWWLMEQAKKRNPDIELAGLAWGAPGWLDGGFWSQDNIDYMLDWLDCAKQHGLKIDYMGGWNESGFDADWYVAFDKALAQHYPDVQIIAADQSRSGLWDVVPALESDRAFYDAVDVVGQHNPCGGRGDAHYRSCPSPQSAKDVGKPLWASEFSALSHEVGARPIARALNRSYIDGRITGQMTWAGISAWYADLPIADTGPVLAEWPWSGHYEVGKSAWAFAHTTQFTEPGWRYLDTGSGRLDSGATVVSLAAPGGEQYSTVVETTDLQAPTTVAFRLEDLPVRPLQVWETDLTSDRDADHFRHTGTITPGDGGFELRLQPGHLYTVSTRTDAGKGDAHPDAGVGAQLPVPFHEGFEGYGDERLARYFSDLSGAFQTEPCRGGRDGSCYEQATRYKPIVWHGTDMPPTTVAGDPRWWGDYRVSADVLLAGADHAELLGRVDGVGGDTAVSGYHLRLARDGAWRLDDVDMGGAETTLASGTVSGFDPGSWHRLALLMQGERVRAFIDDDDVASVRGNQHRVGQIGLRVGGYAQTQFDDVQVTPTGPRPQYLAPTTASASSAHTANEAGYVYPAAAAIDDKPETYWSTEWDPLAPPPHSITLDLGREQTVRALTYRAPISASWASEHKTAPITGYAVSLSSDGEHFEQVASGMWPATPAATKVVNLPGDYEARYVRLSATGDPRGCNDTPVGAGEIGVSSTAIRDATTTEPIASLDHVVPQEQMTATASSWHVGYEPANAIDGNCSTMWHTEYQPTRLPPPHTLTLDLHGSYDVSGLSYLPRQDNNGNGLITRYNVYVSSDGQTFTRVASGDWPYTHDRKLVKFEPQPARYVRLEATEGHGGLASAAEINVGYLPGGTG